MGTRHHRGMARGKKIEPRDPVRELVANVVGCGDLEEGAEMVREVIARAKHEARHNLPITVSTSYPTSRHTLGSEGGTNGDELFRAYVSSGQRPAGPHAVAAKLRELASFIEWSTLEIESADIFVLTRKGPP